MKSPARIIFHPLAGLVVSVFTLSPSIKAQSVTDLNTVVSRCAILPVAAERHACFDAATAHMRNTGNEAASSAAEQTTETDRAVAEFGDSRARVDETEEGAAILHDRIAQLQERQPGQYLITLESGQVWYQTIANSYLRLRKGMDVQIALSTFGGSYHLRVKDTNGFIQVTRVE